MSRSARNSVVAEAAAGGHCRAVIYLRVSATENIDETPSGKLMHGIMATIAEFYSQNLAAEAKKGARQKAKVGGTPYKPPNRYYVGLVQYEGSLYPGRHESLVDEATFEAVQAIMEARRVSGEKPQKRPHYLKGRLYCGACGTRMGINGGWLP